MKLNTNTGKIEAEKIQERHLAKCKALEALKNKSKTVKANKNDSKT